MNKEISHTDVTISNAIKAFSQKSGEHVHANHFAKEKRKEYKKNIFEFSLFIIIIFLCLAFSIFLKAENNELFHEVNACQMELKYANAETVSLDSKLQAIASVQSIDVFAEDKHNIRKAKPSDYIYINVKDFKEKYNKEKGITNVDSRTN